MIILGIDPGTTRIGYGLIEKTNGKLSMKDAGILNIESKEGPKILGEARREMCRLLDAHNIDRCVVEKLFFARNQKTALDVAQARGVIVLTLHERGIPIIECAPNEMKSRMTGYGFADKKAVKKMVEATLRLRPLEMVDDASDALALAIVGSGYVS
jgi:crossover junction endodeoxyribonuclease RuvC